MRKYYKFALACWIRGHNTGKTAWNILWINVKRCKNTEDFFNIRRPRKAPRITFATHWLSSAWKGHFKRASFSVQKSLFWKVKEPLSQRESGTFVFSLCGEYFPFTFVNCFTELKFHREFNKQVQIYMIFS